MKIIIHFKITDIFIQNTFYAFHFEKFAVHITAKIIAMNIHMVKVWQLKNTMFFPFIFMGGFIVY